MPYSEIVITQDGVSGDPKVSRNDLDLYSVASKPIELANDATADIGATSWEWRIIERPPGSTATLASGTLVATTQTTSFQADVYGRYVITLRVNGLTNAQNGYSKVICACPWPVVFTHSSIDVGDWNPPATYEDRAADWDGNTKGAQPELYRILQEIRDHFVGIAEGNLHFSSWYPDLNDCIDAVSSGDTIIIDKPTVLSSAKSLPATSSCIVLRKGIIDLDDYNLTINSRFNCGLQKCFDYTGTGVVIFGNGSVDAIYPEWFGAVADGITNDAAVIQDALAAVETMGDNPAILTFSPNKSYMIKSTLTFSIPEKTTIKAEGATLTSDQDAVMIDLNVDADFTNETTATATTKRQCTWIGGDFINTAGTTTASVALQCHMFRSLKIERARFQSWWHAIEIAGKDTYQMESCYFYQNEYSIVHPSGVVPSGLTGTHTIGTVISECHFSSDGVCSISIEDRTLNTVIKDNVFAGPKGKINIENPHATITSRGATIRDNHFEGNDSTVADVVIDGSAGAGIQGVCISRNDFISWIAGWKGIYCDKVFGLAIDDGCLFLNNLAAASEVAIELDDDVEDVDIGESTQFVNMNTKLLLGSSFDRRKLVFRPAHRIIVNGVITGYSGSTFSTGEAHIDMSSLFTVFPTDCVPKGYHIALHASDTGSAGAAAGAVLVRIKENAAVPGDVSDFTAILIELAGVPNTAQRAAFGYVPADENGDIYIRYKASGANTLTIYIRVVAIDM